MKSNLEMRDIIEAYANGHWVEFCETGSNKWERLDGGCSHICWNMLRYDYRIAPKPLECNVFFANNEPKMVVADNVTTLHLGLNGRIVKMREVIE